MKKPLKKVCAISCAIACSAGVMAALPLISACRHKQADLPDYPEWDSAVTVDGNKVTVKWKEIVGADEYNVYHSTSRYGTYEKVSTQTDLSYSNDDIYGYYKVEALQGSRVISSITYSYDEETFGKNTYIYSPLDDNQKINDDIYAQYEELESGQFSNDRFGVLFKKGEYSDVEMQMGYYTTAAGLGYSPTDVTLGYFNVNAQWFNGNATHNFWRGIENVTVDGDVQWAVSQATSFRRMNVLGGMTLDDGGWSSGGYIADSKIEKTINSGGQQQWFTRNSSFQSYANSGWSRVFVGCQGNVPSGKWPSARNTVIESAEEIAEKPFLVFDDNGYGVFVPEVRKNAVGVSWEGDITGKTIPLSDFYVAQSGRDSAKTINAALAHGKHLIFTPGIYMIDEPILVEKANTVVLGMGLATLKISDKNTDTLMRVSDVDGVNISSILFDAGTKSKSLLDVGGEDSRFKSHADNRIRLSDLYFRVGGAENKNTSVDVCALINASDVTCDHFWIWRADHSYGVGWAEGTYTDRNGNLVKRNANLTKNGIIVNGDNVTAYALMVEHFHEYQTIWNGENGCTYFYQSETPYDSPQEDWMSHNGTVLGYSSYKVDDNVISHRAYGVGVYGYPSGAELANAVEAPKADDVYFEHIVTVFLSGSNGGGIHNVINDVGEEVSPSKFDRTVEYYYGGEIKDTAKN